MNDRDHEDDLGDVGPEPGPVLTGILLGEHLAQAFFDEASRDRDGIVLATGVRLEGHAGMLVATLPAGNRIVVTAFEDDLHYTLEQDMPDARLLDDE